MKNVQRIPLTDFLDGSYKTKPVQKRKGKMVYSFIYINPSAFFDPTVCVIGGIVLGLAIVEKFLAANGHYNVVAKMELIRSIVFPAIAVFGIGYVLSSVGGGWL